MPHARSLRFRSRGFTLMELMVVVAILAILAAIAIPQYQSYVIRSQAARVTSELNSLRLQVEVCLSDGHDSDGTCDLAVLGSNLLQGEPVVVFGEPLSITATFANTANPVLRGQTIALVRAPSGRWTCEASAGVPASVLPGECRNP